MTPLLHPEVTEDPQTLRWVTDTGALPDGLADQLLADGTLASQAAAAKGRASLGGATRPSASGVCELHR